MDKIDRLIEEFLIENPEPKTGDWKRLIEQYPQHASAIADAALINRSFVGLTGASDASFDEACSAQH
jgi:hypothetical protein